MRVISILFLSLFLSIAAFGQQSLREGAPAPEFSGTSMNGQIYDLNRLRGNIVVVTFWSTRCNICHSEIPKLNRLAEQYKGRNVVFLALTMENEAKVQGYLRSTEFNFNILPNSFGVVLQYADRDRQGNIDMGFPAHFIVNQNGQIDMRASGWDKTNELQSRIAKLLSTAGLNNSGAAQAAAGTK